MPLRGPQAIHESNGSSLCQQLVFSGDSIQISQLIVVDRPLPLPWICLISILKPSKSVTITTFCGSKFHLLIRQFVRLSSVQSLSWVAPEFQYYESRRKEVLSPSFLCTVYKFIKLLIMFPASLIHCMQCGFCSAAVHHPPSSSSHICCGKII